MRAPGDFEEAFAAMARARGRLDHAPGAGNGRQPTRTHRTCQQIEDPGRLLATGHGTPRLPHELRPEQSANGASLSVIYHPNIAGRQGGGPASRAARQLGFRVEHEDRQNAWDCVAAIDPVARHRRDRVAGLSE